MRQLAFATIALSLILMGFSCLGGSNVQIQPVTLEYWRIDDSPDALAPAIEAYQKEHPNVTINVRSFRFDEYENSLLVALAEDRGPDLFNLPNVWLESWKGKLLPLPEKTVVPTQVVDSERKQLVATNLEEKSLTLLDLRNQFVEVVEDDVVMLTPTTGERGEVPTEEIWGLPYSVDTLALFYNVDLLRQANISAPPDTWKEFQDQVKTLTVYDDQDQIEQSAAAIGTAQNVRHSTDLLSAIMIQNGAEMVNENGRVNFARIPAGLERERPPGVEALIFYQAFTNERSTYYTWNNDLPDSMDAFIQGKTAFYFGYPYDRIEIAERAPQLNFTVAELPQVSPSNVRNIAHYPVEVVSAKSRHPNEAWNFLQFAANADHVRDFLAATDRPTALRSLISEQLTDPEAKPFVSQLLTADSWYNGEDWPEVVEIFDTMIETYPTIEEPNLEKIVTTAANLVQRTY